MPSATPPAKGLQNKKVQLSKEKSIRIRVWELDSNTNLLAEHCSLESNVVGPRPLGDLLQAPGEGTPNTLNDDAITPGKGNQSVTTHANDLSGRSRADWPIPTEEAYEVAPLHMKLYYDVRNSGVPNHMGVRRPVPSDMKCDAWEHMLSGYADAEIVDFLRFGWPVAYTAPTIPTPTFKNHASATRFPDAIDKFIEKELSKNALLGPFIHPPFDSWTQISPLMTRDKPDGSGKRVIIDLSYPVGASVNDGILKSKDPQYSLPTPLDLADLMLREGRGCFMWKSDLSRAYRQLRVDPLDYPLLAIQHKGLTFVDICPSFGCRASGSAQQRVSNAVVHLMQGRGHDVLAYVDDFCGIAASPNAATSGFNEFHTLTDQLGLKLAPDKTCPPATTLEWLGFWFDSNELTISIPQNKLTELLAETESWLQRDYATKQQIQSLAGKLNHISLCVRPARRFMSRILEALRDIKDEARIQLTQAFKLDVRWFCEYAKFSNHRILIEPKLPFLNLECDACPQGGGGFSDTAYYQVVFPDRYRNTLNISQIEALNLVIALKTLIPDSLSHARILVKTDNTGAQCALSTGRTRDPILAACAREVWLLSAVKQVDILIHHAPGDTLVLADALSRASFNPGLKSLAGSLVLKYELSRVTPVCLSTVLTLAI